MDKLIQDIYDLAGVIPGSGGTQINATSGTNVLWYIPPSGTNMIFYDQNTTAPEDMADHFKAGSYLIVSAVYEV